MMKKFLLLGLSMLPLVQSNVARAQEKPAEKPAQTAPTAPVSEAQRALLTQNYAAIDKALLAGEFDKVEAMQSPNYVSVSRSGEVSTRESVNKNIRELFKIFVKLESLETKIEKIENSEAGLEATVTMTIKGRIKGQDGEHTLQTVATAVDLWRPKADDAKVWQQNAAQEIKTVAFIDGQEIALP